MNEMLTVVGRVATDPTEGTTGAGVTVTNFRLASTHRRFDPATQTWIETGTNWFSVAAFRQLGEHARLSLRTGDSVIVTGRLKIRSWERDGRQGTSADIEADAIGHDLRWGTTTYRPRTRPAPADAASHAEEPSAAQGTGVDEDAAAEADRADDAVWALPPVTGSAPIGAAT